MHSSRVANRGIHSSCQVLAGVCLLLGSNHAFAAAGASCADDAECGDGYSCEVTASGGSCTKPSCAKGEACPPAVCETFEIHSCVPGPCSSDSDCVDDMVCHSTTYATCSGSGAVCKPGEVCPQPPPPTCSEYTESKCTPRYELPCRVDADCGAGFRCTEELAFQCQDGAPAGAPRPAPGTSAAAVDAGVAVLSPLPTTPAAPSDLPADDGTSCTQVPSGRFSCQLLTLPCTSDANCPAGMSCESDEVSCTVKPTADGSSSEGVDSTGSCGAPAGEPTHVCRPASYGSGAVPGASADDPNGTGGVTGGASGPVDAGLSTDAAAPVPPSEPDRDDDDPHGDKAPGRHRGSFRPWFGPHHGCSLAQGEDPLGAGLSVLLGLGLVAVLHRRRSL